MSLAKFIVPSMMSYLLSEPYVQLDSFGLLKGWECYCCHWEYLQNHSAGFSALLLGGTNDCFLLWQLVKPLLHMLWDAALRKQVSFFWVLPSPVMKSCSIFNNRKESSSSRRQFRAMAIVYAVSIVS